MGLLDDIVPGIVSDVIGLLVDNPATLTRVPEGEYEPLDGEEYEQPPQTYPVKVTPPEGFKITAPDGAVKQRWRAYYSVADLSIQPNSNTDTFTYQGIEYKVVGANPVSTGDAAGLWELVIEL